jgi:glycosyltransferase involved in cell wall biosynthesis
MEDPSLLNNIFDLDLDPLAEAIKRHCFPLQLQFIAPSTWAAKRAEATSLFQSLPQLRPIKVIPNALDPVFLREPNPAAISRKCSDKPLLLFGASNAFSDARKGWQLLEPLLSHLAKAYPHWHLGTFGEVPPDNWHCDMPCEHHGSIHDPNELAALYRQASLFVVPSQQETFGQVAAEAQACGVPVVALANSGVASLLKHGETGFLIQKSSSEALWEGLCFFMDQQPEQLALAGIEASKSAKKSFAPEIVAKAHLDLYREILA